LTIVSAYHTIKTPYNVDNRHVYANLSSVAELFTPVFKTATLKQTTDHLTSLTIL